MLKPCKPTFLGIGAAKAGTTTIASLLASHPEINFPISGAKEIHYFDEKFLEKPGSWYFSQFEENRAVGEFTPSYLFLPECRDRIFETLGPHTKFIVALRNPVDRAYSHYCHAVNNWGQPRYREIGYPVEELDFESALAQENTRLASGLHHIRHLSYFSKGLYARQLKWYYQCFPPENFYIYLLEDYAADPGKTLAEICAFLEVDQSFKFKDIDKKLNTQARVHLPPAIRSRLGDQYLPSIKALEELLHQDLSIWKTENNPVQAGAGFRINESSPEKNAPPIFIVGSPRSGTTLLQCMLAAHSKTFSLPETHFFCTLLPELGLSPWDSLTPDKLDEVYAGLQKKMALKWPDSILENLKTQAGEGNMAALDVFLRLIDFFRPASDTGQKLRLVEKTPYHVFHLEEILECFPSARFVNLVRDPRDVASSRRLMPTAPHQSLRLFARDWTRCVKAASSFAGRHPDRIISLKYEFLASQPEIALKRICAFLEIEYESSMVADFASQHGACTLPERENWKAEIRTGQIRNKAGVWQDRITPEEARQVETETQARMSAFGYSLSVPQEKFMNKSAPLSLADPFVKQALASSREKLARYKDRHHGQRCVIIGNGPSLNKMDLSFLKNEITFGMNRIYLGFEKWGFTPSYYVSVNTLVIEQSVEEMVKIPAPRFISIYGLPFVDDPGDFIFLKPVYGPLFARNPIQGICEGHTVTYVAMQLAYFMGFSEVVLIGVDHNFVTPGPANQEIVSEGQDMNHFDPDYFGKGVRWQLPDLKNSEVAYRLARCVFESENRAVLDATVGGKLAIFPRLDYRTLIAKSKTGESKKEPLQGEQLKPSLTDDAAPEALPRVSVIVCSKNQPENLRKTLESLEAQTYSNLEILLVNCQNAEIKFLAEEFNQRLRVVLINPEMILSTAKARNLALQRATGEFAAYLDEGDCFSPDHIAALASYLLGHSQYIAACSRTTEIVTVQRNGELHTLSRSDFDDRPFDQQKLLVTNTIPYLSFMHRRMGLEQMVSFDEELEVLENWDFLIRLSLAGEIIYLPVPGGQLYWRAGGREVTNPERRPHSASEYLKVYQKIFARYAAHASPQTRKAQDDFLSRFDDYQSFSPDLGARAWPQGVTTLVQEANDCVTAGNLSKAEQILVEVLELAPNDPWLRVTHGNLLLELGEGESARQEFTKTIAFFPEYAPAHASLGAALLQVGQSQEARRAFEQALALDSDNRDLRALLESFPEEKAVRSQTQESEGESRPTPAGVDKISVIVSTYASEAFMRECLEDLVHQTISDRLEIIVVDAHSPENERQIIEEFQRSYPNIQYIRTEGRIGVYAAWNLAIRASTGKYITPFSTNDRLRKDAYEILAQALDQHPEVMLVYGDTYLTPNPHETFEEHTSGEVYRWPDYSFEELLQNCQVGPHPMWRREIHALIGYFDERYLSVGDQEFWLRIGEQFPMFHIPEFTGLYWDTPEALSKKGQAPHQEIAEIHRIYQSRYFAALNEWVNRVQRGEGLSRPDSLFLARFGFLPTTPIGVQTLEAVRSQSVSGIPGRFAPSPPQKGANTPLISAIVSTYNAEKYMRACLADLEAQTVAQQLEIIVIDSGSTQREGRIVAEFQESYDNIIYLRTARENLYEAWNRGIQMARGKYITNANTDDAHRPDALERLIAALESHPGADLAYGNYAWSSVPNDSFTASHAYKNIIHPPYHPSQAMFYCILGCHPVWRRTVFEKIGLFDTAFSVVGDYEFFLRFVEAGLSPIHVPEVLSLFYQNPEGLTHQSDKARREVYTLHQKYRAQTAITRLYHIDPADSHQVARAWSAQGTLALNCSVPWLDAPHKDLEYALACFKQALKLDPDCAPALKNIITLLGAMGKWEEVEELTPHLPKEGARELVSRLEKGEFEIISVQVPSAVKPLEYTNGQSESLSRGHVIQEAAGRNAQTDIVIPIYGQPDLVERCVDSVLATTENVHLILVDDCSPGDEIEAVFARWRDHPQVTLARQPENKGFIATCKTGAALGTAPFILFLNSDTEAKESGWLEKLMPLEDDLAITGARLIYPQDAPGPLAGTIQHAGIARNPAGVPYHPFLGMPADDSGANTSRDVNAVTGACYLIRRRVWEELGGWDNRFGRGVYEDVDLCWRARRAGYRIRYQADACLVHHESASKAEDGSHSLNAHTRENLKLLQSRWPRLDSDEAIFVGEKTARRWRRARQKVRQAEKLVAKSDFPSAIRAARQAVNTAPGLVEATLAYAQLVSTQGDHRQAIQYFVRAVEAAPAHWEARLRLVDEYLTAGELDQARVVLEPCQTIFPDHPKVKQRADMLALFTPQNGKTGGRRGQPAGLSTNDLPEAGTHARPSVKNVRAKKRRRSRRKKK